MISLIIPVLNEENNIEALLTHVAALHGTKEIIVVDGGSTDRTRELALPLARVADCRRGRGPQCNAGARLGRGDILFFLHADSRLEQDAMQKIERAVAQGASWGCLKLRFDDTHWLTRIIALGSNLRVRLRGIAFGDQGIFMTRELFNRVGGFSPLPLMEDYQLSLDLRANKVAPVQVDSCITSLARRFIADGRLRTIWRMHRLRQLYRRGTEISVIQAMYRDVR